MKRTPLLWAVLVLYCPLTKGQRLPVGFNAHKTWETVKDMRLSEDGRYFSYAVANQPAGGHTLVVKPVNGKWERRYPGGRGDFAERGSSFVLEKEDGTKTALQLLSNRELPYQAMPAKQAPFDSHLLRAYRIAANQEGIQVKDDRTGQTTNFDNVSSFALTPAHDAVLFVSQEGLPAGSAGLYKFHPASGEKTLLWTAAGGARIFLDEGAMAGLNNHLLFRVEEPETPIDPALAEVDVWTWQDAADPMPFDEKQRTVRHYAVSGTAPYKIIPLNGPDEKLQEAFGDYALLRYNENGSSYEVSWNPKARTSYYLVSLVDGSRQLVATQSAFPRKAQFEAALSPDGKQVVIADANSMTYSVFDVATSRRSDLSKGQMIACTFNDTNAMFLDFNLHWSDPTHFVVRDDYDLWMLDVKGNSAPLCLTAGEGRKNKLVFFPVYIEGQAYKRYKELTKTNDMYLLHALDEKDKSWGFYKMTALSGKPPVKLHMGPYYYGGDGLIINKAKKADCYYVIRESVTEAPNAYLTRDFISFTKLTDIRPQEKYNWMTNELLRWTTEEGFSCEGTLYKPQDFDPAKKYPVVLMIYNQYTKQLNAFMEPHEHSERNGWGNVLPACWLVSNGYLVLIPDLKMRRAGQRLKDSRDMVVAAVQKLSDLPYVDAARIGLEGSSWGGEQVNYIVTHTNIFAAAFTGAGFTEHVSGSGFSDAVSSRNNFMHNETVLNGNLANAPERYINEAALFSAHKVTTPVLIKHNKDDGAVPFYQGLQFFRLLRRLGKPAWMLQYENGGHGIPMGKPCEDMCTRVSQFFDHYLRGKPAPRWMTQGISPERKQIDMALELDQPTVKP